MHRRLDWRSRLHAWGTAQVGKPFVWGETDCGSLSRKALEMMFGVDIMPVLPVYNSWSEAVVAKHQVARFGSFLTKLGALEGEPAFMRAGDIVVAPEPD